MLRFFPIKKSRLLNSSKPLSRVRRKSLRPFWLPHIIVIFAFTACEKEKSQRNNEQDVLPATTQSGEHTFGCMIDGELWLPKSNSSSIVNPPVALQASFFKDDSVFFISAANHRKNDSSPREFISLYHFTNRVGEKTSLLDSLQGSGCIYEYEPYKDGPYKTYKSVLSQDSWIKFSRFDTIAGIASGTFSVDLKNMNDENDTISIRNGRFDVLF